LANAWLAAALQLSAVHDLVPCHAAKYCLGGGGGSLSTPTGRGPPSIYSTGLLQ
jgi:hypothetical protein